MATQEELTNLLSILYTNLNNLDSIYYDMFINTVPMDVTLERYDEAGILQTYVLPNRAKDSQYILQGTGNPNGIISGNTGVIYLDISSSSLYFKSIGTDTYGWVKIFSTSNFLAGTNYLSPTGNGSQITNLSGSNITSGTVNSTYLPSDTTFQGNTFNGINQLTQTDSIGRLPSSVLPLDAVEKFGTISGGTITLLKDRFHTVTFSAPTTIVLPTTGLTTGVHYNCSILVTLSSVVTITQPTVTWVYSNAPVMNSTTAKYRLIYETSNAGSTWYGYWTQLGL